MWCLVPTRVGPQTVYGFPHSHNTHATVGKGGILATEWWAAEIPSCMMHAELSAHCHARGFSSLQIWTQ